MIKCFEEIFSHKQVVSFLGHDFNIGFIPVGQSAPLLEYYQTMVKKEMANTFSPQEILQAKIEMLARFCSFVYPEMDENYIQQQATLAEVDKFFNTVMAAVLHEVTKIAKNKKSSSTSKKNFRF